MRSFVLRSIAFSTALAAFFTAGAARADEPEESAQAAPPATTQPAAAAAPTPADDGGEGRLRIGFNFLNGGLGTGGNLSGPALGATLKIGYQFNDLMGLYGNISPFVWIGSSSETVVGQSVDIGAITGVQLAPLFSLSPVDIFEVAAGPSLDYLTGGGVSTSVAGAGETTVGGFSSAYFGLHAKAALHLGGRSDTGRRRGFTIEGNLHPTFAEGSTVTFFTLGLGYDWM